ncbi:hypothetical protein [Deinococcus sp. Marseille-Q6407]|uniref:hypothetical protein n=1 Tax=Deinococcus sp. Marseille-Q6407 TaxID=2969223 RepID=UPI0021BE4624|nr:hypothetical protein [Deinococcus sp. Marseille-Q6407]
MTGPKQPRQDTQAGVPGGRLTREMQLLIGALLTLLLAGALVFYFNSRNNQAVVEESTTSSTTTQTDSSTVTTVTTNTASAAAAGPVSGSDAAPGTIPPLSTAPETASGAQTQPKLGGINPETPLAAVPAKNPFKPFVLESDGSTPAGAVQAPSETPASPEEIRTSEPSVIGQPASPERVRFSEPSVAISAPPSSAGSGFPGGAGESPADGGNAPTYTASVPSDSRSGAVAPVSRASGRTTSWVLGPGNKPVAVTSGGNGGASSSSQSQPGSNTTARTSSNGGSTASTSRGDTQASSGSGRVPTASAPRSSTGPRPANSSASGSNAPSNGTSGGMATWVLGGGGPGSTGSTGPSGAGSQGPATAPAPAPVAGVTAPPVGSALAKRPAVQPANGSGSAAAPALSVPLPVPGQPDLITRYGDDQGVGAPDDGTALSRALNRQDVRFTGAVLGPTDTAIFKSSQGFMVLAQGDRLPDTQIVVSQITADSVTLALGQDSLKLELEPLQ